MIITDVLSHSFNQGLPIAFPDSLSSDAPLLRIGVISIVSGEVWSLGHRHRRGGRFLPAPVPHTRQGGRSAQSRRIPTARASWESPFSAPACTAMHFPACSAGSSPSSWPCSWAPRPRGWVSRLRTRCLPCPSSRAWATSPEGWWSGLLLGVLEAIVQGYISGLMVERHRVRHHAGRDPGEAEGALRHEAVEEERCRFRCTTSCPSPR